MRQSEPVLTRFLRFFFYLLYQPFAWSYDFVAWVVSLGQWKTWIQTTLPEVSGSRILELGHGPGHLQVAMRKKGKVTFGLDASRQMSKLANKRLRRLNYPIRLVRAKARHLPYNSAAFDQVVATFPSEYIFEAETLAEVHRVLIPGGSLIVLPMAWIRGAGLFAKAAAWLFRVTKQAGEWTGLLSQALTKAGFRVNEKRVKLHNSEIMLVVGTIAPPTERQ